MERRTSIVTRDFDGSGRAVKEETVETFEQVDESGDASDDAQAILNRITRLSTMAIASVLVLASTKHGSMQERIESAWRDLYGDDVD